MSLCIIGWSLIDYGGQRVILPNCLYFILMICQPECWEFWGLGIGSISFLRCCAFIFSGGSKTVSCLQSVATLGNQSNRVLNKVQAHLAGHLCWFSILAWCKPDASLCSEIPPLSWTIYQGSNTQERRGQGKQNQSGEHSSCKSWIRCVIDTQALNYELNLYQSDTVKDKHMIVDPSQLNVIWLEMETVPFIDSDAASVFKSELSSPTCRSKGKKCVLSLLLAEFDNLGCFFCYAFSTR